MDVVYAVIKSWYAIIIVVYLTTILIFAMSKAKIIPKRIGLLRDISVVIEFLVLIATFHLLLNIHCAERDPELDYSRTPLFVYSSLCKTAWLHFIFHPVHITQKYIKLQYHKKYTRERAVHKPESKEDCKTHLFRDAIWSWSSAEINLLVLIAL